MKKGIAGLPMLGFLLWPLLASAQIEVSFPVSRVVFQRNAANTATFRITGSYRTVIARVQARMVARGGQGTTTDWALIQSNAQGGIFAGDLTTRAGWYNLEVQGLDGNNQPVGETIVVERVGVGEVFVVAGQSNGQGIRKNVPPSNEDRVNCVQYADPNPAADHDPPFPQFRHVDADVDMAPNGVGAWCWGGLGDQLVARLNVPVLFLNAAFGGTSSRNWRESAENGITTSEYQAGSTFPLGQPYGNLRSALRNYVNMLGVRSVLWHQGEADNFTGTSAGQYADNLRYVINRSRQDCGKNVPWVIARASYDDLRKSDLNVLAGQDQVIATVGNAFAGPNTDLINIPRSVGGDDTHFSNDGLIDVARAWNTSLTDAFFAGAAPQSPALAPTILVACAGNQLTLSVNGTPASVAWNTGDVGPSITKGQGNYRAQVKDGFGNAHYTASVPVSGSPFIALSGPATFCKGERVSLTTNYQTNITWSNGQTTRTITSDTSGRYSARYRDVSGCEFVTQTVDVVANPLPSAPTITPNRSTTLCQRETVVLTASPSAVYNWSTGEKSRSINVNTPGSFALTVTDQNGCTSASSTSVTTQVNPLPATPTIAASGATTFCADQNVTLTSTAEAGYAWVSGQTTQALTVNQTGNYSTQTRNSFGCLSDPSNTISIRVNALPPTPSLVANGRTTFCEGDRVTLTVTSPFKPIWTTGDSVQTITATRSGNYTVRVVDANGCFSLTAPAIMVSARPVPTTPTIRQVGTYTLEAEGPIVGDVYRWQRDADSLTVRSAVIKASQSGTYSARASITYNPDLICYSQNSAPLAFVVVTENGGLSVYPNPSPAKEVLVETLRDLTNATLTIYTLSGQEAYSTVVPVFNERKRLELINLATGPYILEVRSADFRVTKRIIIGL